MSSFNPFQSVNRDNPFEGVSPGFGVTGSGTDRMYGWGSGQGSRQGEIAGSNTLGYNIIGTVARDPISRYLHEHTSGWLQDPGAAVLKWLSGPEAPAPAAPPPQLAPLQSAPGSANPAASTISQMRSQALRGRPHTQQLQTPQGPNFGGGPGSINNPQYPVVSAA